MRKETGDFTHSGHLVSYFFFLHLILRFRFPILDKSKDKWAKKIFYPIIILLFDIYIHSTMFLNLMIDYYESWIYSIYISSAFEILMNERINYFLTEHDLLVVTRFIDVTIMGFPYVMHTYFFFFTYRPFFSFPFITCYNQIMHRKIFVTRMRV